jgi:TolA protein
VDDIPDPQKVDPLPDLPPPPPKVETSPKTETKVPEVKPTVKPPPKTAEVKPTVKPPPKTEPKKDPPKSNLLTADQIKVKTNTKTQAQIDAERKAREAAEAKARADAKARQDILADIRATAGAGQQQGRYGTTDPGQKGILATKEMRDYYDQLTAFIRPKWSAASPSTVELGGKVSNWPVVDLTIAKDGRITNAVVVTASGNKAIDAAVKVLLSDLKVVPAPPQAAVIRITLDIR